MFALLPLPPTDHQLQQRRLRYAYGEDAMTARHRPGTHQPAEHRPTIRVRLAVAAILLRVGERLMGSPSSKQAVPGLEAAIDPGTAAR